MERIEAAGEKVADCSDEQKNAGSGSTRQQRQRE